MRFDKRPRSHPDLRRPAVQLTCRNSKGFIPFRRREDAILLLSIPRERAWNLRPFKRPRRTSHRICRDTGRRGSEDRCNTTFLPIICGISCSLCRFHRGKTLVGHELSTVLGAPRVDAFHGLLQLFRILIYFPLHAFSEIAVDLVPGLGVFGEIIFFPLGDVALDETDPHFFIIFHNVR